MEEYKPNSRKSKEDAKDKKIEKVVTGEVKAKKKNEIRKIADVFISEDAGNVKSYIFQDILVPAIKKAISDIVTNGIDIILYGGTGRTKKKASSSNVSYRSYYEKDRDHDRYNSSRNRTVYSYDDVIIEDRGEAENVLSQMDDLIELYGMVSVAEFYEMVGISGNYTDNKYGWTDIHTASVVRTRDGYIIKLPKAVPLN